MRLVVCIDRDDDLGRKAGVLGPVLGRSAVLEAATKLGIADPEDSDTNAMFASVRLYDELLQQGEEAEVVVLTGSPKVGLFSDRKVAEQFDKVLQQIPADAAHLISDGAEDEYLAPILGSRVHLDGVHRIHIRQSETIESTYYTIVKALKDPKLRSKTVLPLAVILLGIAIAAASGVFWWGVTGLLILIGVYLIAWTFDIDEAIIDSVRSASTDIRSGSVAVGFGVLAIGIGGIGLVQGYNAYLHRPSGIPLDRIVGFAEAGLIWWLSAGEVWEVGRALRWYIARSRIPRSFPIATISIVGTGLVSFGLLMWISNLESFSPSLSIFAVAVLLALGIGLVVSAGVVSQYLKSRSAPPSPAV